MVATAGADNWYSAGDGNAGPSLHRAFGMHDLPALTHEFGDQFIGGANLLKSDHIGLGGGDPIVQTLSGGSSETVDVYSGDSQHPMMLARSGLFRVLPGARRSLVSGHDFTWIQGVRRSPRPECCSFGWLLEFEEASDPNYRDGSDHCGDHHHHHDGRWRNGDNDHCDECDEVVPAFG